MKQSSIPFLIIFSKTMPICIKRNSQSVNYYLLFILVYSVLYSHEILSLFVFTDYFTNYRIKASSENSFLAKGAVEMVLNFFKTRDHAASSVFKVTRTVSLTSHGLCQQFPEGSSPRYKLIFLIWLFKLEQSRETSS